jgi:small subunit ribosomal protein S16
MLKIRLQRVGRINMPSFRLIVAEHTSSPKTGRFVEKLGTYNPKTKQQNLLAERIKYWLSVGAKPSGTVHNMLVNASVISGKKVNVLPKKSPPKPADAESSGDVKKDELAEGGAQEAAPAPAGERSAPAEEKPASTPAEEGQKAE